jgi:DDE superfamily endonuclease
MEDILEVSTRPSDPRFPQICMDESAKHLLQDKRERLPMQKGAPERVDYTFESAGMRKIFLACEPLAGKRFVSVTERRASEDWAYFIRDLVDVHHPNAEKIVLVMDNLNTHTPSSLYSTFTPPEAYRVLKKLEIHYTPVHGSWLNMAEIELSALARQCLSRRIGGQEELEREVQAWQERRNAEATTVNWRFTTADARIKLKRLYPSLEKKKSSASTGNVAKKD